MELILGGMASGKSQYAERRLNAVSAGLPMAYVGTIKPNPNDQELMQKIALHQSRRENWITVEETGSRALLRAIQLSREYAVLLDGVGLALAGEPGASWEAALKSLSAIESARPFIVVSDQVGEGLVPLDGETRRFVEQLGRLNQSLAELAARVVWIMAGIPLVIKGEETSWDT